MRPEGTPDFPLSHQHGFLYTASTRHNVPGLISSTAPRPPQRGLQDSTHNKRRGTEKACLFIYAEHFYALGVEFAPGKWK
jgi:hypothetical protein